ncbi:Sir2 family NAD-dependent protein deacetylase [Brevibacterium sp. 91QC2O2]|uniref:SIR2 family NAD-dependent protein deacylase n=1 Tax=Brevibacterium sp. 91QC2O2 TaxID=2968458 RepID=UPI00211D0CBC|nr:Sir2 family NAD-dependent protein deacetylase [Brevibacterium sp. 91QC2O2]MCQ9368952.1 Sir2 family NAD-dependent protein deacetylase [Brevibacterium sp. 91QC2O2]
MSPHALRPFARIRFYVYPRQVAVDSSGSTAGPGPGTSSPSVVFFTGAGISTAAGIPDFRGPAGVWTCDPDAERTSTLSLYLSDEAVRRAAWQRIAASPVWKAAPTAVHRAIASELVRDPRAVVITQNTDGLHQLAGVPADRIIEVHGSLRRWRCESCAATGEMMDMVIRVRAGSADPRCPECGGIVRARTILFGEALDAAVVDRAFELAAGCSVLLALGTSLTVAPIAELVPTAVRAGARTVIVNAQATPYDFLVSTVVRGNVQTELAGLLSASQ